MDKVYFATYVLSAGTLVTWMALKNCTTWPKFGKELKTLFRVKQ